MAAYWSKKSPKAPLSGTSTDGGIRTQNAGEAKEASSRLLTAKTHSFL